jgi:hypothetical protein
MPLDNAAKPSSDRASYEFDLAQWSAPVIADRVGEFYGSYLDCGQIEQDDEAVKIARRHCRMWLCLLQSREAEARACRRDLLRLSKEMRLDPAQIDAVDRAIIDELMDIIIGRFGRSRGTAHAYGMTLVAAASSLAEARLAA